MDKKPIETKEEQPVETKKVYTPPTLTVYGKLTELTGGNPLENTPENSGTGGSTNMTRRP